MSTCSIPGCGNPVYDLFGLGTHTLCLHHTESTVAQIAEAERRANRPMREGSLLRHRTHPDLGLFYVADVTGNRIHIEHIRGIGEEFFFRWADVRQHYRRVKRKGLRNPNA